MDPDFYTDDIEAKDEDWSESFFEETDGLSTPFDEPNDELLYPDELNADQLGTALAFGEVLSDDRDAYDMDKDTDKENWENVMKLYPLQGIYHSTDSRSLSKFEQYINEITSGQLKGPWQRD